MTALSPSRGQAVPTALPLALPLALTGVGLLTRFGIIDPGVPHTAPALWLFALGWAIARARTVWQRVLLTAVALASVPGYFEDDPKRNAIILGGVLLLIWLRSVPVPSALHRPLGILASASLYAYLTHWLVYPVVDDHGKGLAVSRRWPPALPTGRWPPGA